MSITEDLVDLGRELVDLGLVRGTAGNISIAHADGRVAISPSGHTLGELRADQVTTARFDGSTLVDVQGPKPTKETSIHEAFYRRMGHGTVVHTHSIHAMSASCLPPWSEHCAIPPHAPYFPMKVGNCPLIDYRHPGDPELGALIDAADCELEAVLLAHHGMVVGAGTTTAAITAAVELEEACRLAVSLSGVAGARMLGEDQVAELARRSGRPWGMRE